MVSNEFEVPLERRQAACQLLTPEAQQQVVADSGGEAGDCPTALDGGIFPDTTEFPGVVNEQGESILDSEGNDGYREVLNEVPVNIAVDDQTAYAILHGTSTAYELTNAEGRWLISRAEMVPVAEETIPAFAYASTIRQCVMDNAQQLGFPGQFGSDEPPPQGSPEYPTPAPLNPDSFSYRTPETVDGGGFIVNVDSFASATTAENLVTFFEQQREEQQEVIDSGELFDVPESFLDEGDTASAHGKSLLALFEQQQKPIENAEQIQQAFDRCAQQALEASMQPPGGVGNTPDGYPDIQPGDPVPPGE
jgi:hypothetical protein